MSTPHIHPTYQKSKRLIARVGYVALGIGLVGFALPLVPGIVFVLAGLSLLSTQSRRAHAYAARLRSTYPNHAEELRKIETWLLSTLQLSMHAHEYKTTTNRGGYPLHLLVEQSRESTGCAIVLHSASGTMETAVSNILAESAKARGCTVVRFDARLGLNERAESGYTEFTASSFLEDLEDVIAYLKTTTWGKGPYVLVGHSVGALVAGWYAAAHQGEVERLVLFAPTVSGASYEAAFRANDPQGFLDWQNTRLRMVRHPLSKDAYGLSFGFVEDLRRYDLMTRSVQLTIPIHIIAAGDDVTAPVSDSRALAHNLHDRATFHCIPGIAHTPKKLKELHALEDTLHHLDAWSYSKKTP